METGGLTEESPGFRNSKSGDFYFKKVRMMKRILLAVLLLQMCLTLEALSETFFVDVNSPNNPGTGTAADPFRKIQDAIDNSADGDVIEIKPGTYTGDGNCNLDPNGKSITIRSINPDDANIRKNTVIDPNQAGRGFYFHNGEDENCVISGLTIKNGSATDYGGGIYCYETSPLIEKCIIKGNHSNDSGGGLFSSYGSPQLTDCLITNNEADSFGGGISSYQSSIKLEKCVVITNTAAETGGGIDFSIGGSPALSNCIIADNQSKAGGGLGCYSLQNLNLSNCTIVANQASESGGALYIYQCDKVDIVNSILRANNAPSGSEITMDGTTPQASISYSNIAGGANEINDPSQDLQWADGNIDTEPYFVSFDPAGDPNLWDLHLQSEYGRWDADTNSWVSDTTTSPCIDAGDPNSSWENEPWANGKRINIGAFGGTEQASKNGNPADFDINGSVDFEDFALFSEKWNNKKQCIQDLTLDSSVNHKDLDIFCENWLWQSP